MFNLSFAIVTNGSTITFRVFIWRAARVALPPQIYVIESMIFLFTLAMMLLTCGSSAAPSAWHRYVRTSPRRQRGSSAS